MIQPLAEGSLASQPDLASIISRDAVWLNELERAESDASIADPQSLGLYGPREGLLALEESGKIVYAQGARLQVGSGGRLVDEHDRAVLGYAVDSARLGAAKPILVPTVAQGRAFSRYEIDERGLIVGIPVQNGTTSEPVPLARIAVALFPAPQRLLKAGDVLAESPLAGQPVMCPADAANIGGLIRHPTSAATAELQEQARQAYAAGAQAELQVSLVSSGDALVRVALDVVK